jgi:prevent-host-death family protein
MKKVGVAELKARLSENLRGVRDGEEIIVMDRDTPVARIVPYTTSGALRVREPSGKYKRPFDVPLPAPLKIDWDPLELLLDDRNSGR